MNPFQREILSSLHTGEQSLLPLIYGCEARFPEQPRDLLVRITVGTICGLMRAGFVTAYRELPFDRAAAVTVAEMFELSQTGAIRWCQELGCWRFREPSPEAAAIQLHLTPRGHESFD